MKKIFFLLFFLVTFSFSATIGYNSCSYYPGNKAFIQGGITVASYNNCNETVYLLLGVGKVTGYTISQDACNSPVYLKHNGKPVDISSFKSSTVPFGDELCCAEGYRYDPGPAHCSPDPNYHHCAQDEHKNSKGSCVKNCPLPLIQVVKNDKIMCVVDKNIDKQSCENTYKAHWFQSPTNFNNFFGFKTGCYPFDVQRKISNVESEKLSQSLAISTMFEAGGVYSFAKKIFTRGKSLLDYIKDTFFRDSSEEGNLFSYDYQVSDVKIGDDGVEPVINSTQKNSYPGYEPTSGDISDIEEPNFDLPAPTQTDNIPFNVNENDFYMTDNIIGTKDILDDNVVPDLNNVSEKNKPVKSKINLKDSFLGTDTQQFDVETMLTDTIQEADYTQKTYKSSVSYPDKTKTNLDVVRKEYSDGSVVTDITAKSPLSDGSVFQKKYSVSTSSDGTTTTVSEPAEIIKQNDDGSKSVVTNTGSSLTVSKNDPIVDLSKTNRNLEKVDDELKEIKNSIKDMIDFKPKNSNEAEQYLKNFSDALTSFDVNVTNFLDYLKNLESSFNNLKNQFEDTKNILENKPTLNNVQSGTCVLSINYHGSHISADPCSFIVKYRPMLSVFFTLLGSIMVFSFGFKYLIGGRD